MIGPGVIVKLCPELPNSMAWGQALTQAAEEFGIDTPTQQAMWIAQLVHESSGFTRLVENLSYSANRLAQVWPHRFAMNPKAIDLGPNRKALQIAHQPAMIANEVYADRMGNGPPYSGDGWHFRGRYPLQLTGRHNYQACQAEIGIPDLLNPDALLEDIPGMARVCGWFWRANNFGPVADEGDLTAVVQKWNGGQIGVKDRAHQYQMAMLAMGIA